MKKINLLFVALFAAFTFTSCQSSSTKKTIDEVDTKESIPEFFGAYSNVLPCADCEGIQTTLVLDEDMTFEKFTRYLGKEITPFVEEGTFSWNASEKKITLENGNSDSPAQYILLENGLLQLDMDGNKIDSELADQYLLFPIDHLVNHHWRLTELFGKPISEELHDEPYLIFQTKENQLTGNAGCNSLSGYYILRSGNRIEIPPFVKTLKMCLNMEIENQLSKAIGMTDSYSITQDTLSLNRARMAPLAKFIRAHE